MKSLSVAIQMRGHSFGEVYYAGEVVLTFESVAKILKV